MVKRHRIPDYILVGHASSLVFAAKNTIRMAALTGRVGSVFMPWGLCVKTTDLLSHYVARDGVAISPVENCAYIYIKSPEDQP